MYLVCVCWADMQRTKTPTRNTHTRIETDIPRPKLHELQFRLAFRCMGGLSRGGFPRGWRLQRRVKNKGRIGCGWHKWQNGNAHRHRGRGGAWGWGVRSRGSIHAHTGTHGLWPSPKAWDAAILLRPAHNPQNFPSTLPPQLLHQPPLHIRAAGALPREV